MPRPHKTETNVHVTARRMLLSPACVVTSNVKPYACAYAFCARLPAAEAPAPEVAPSYPYLASYAVFLLSFATVRLLSSCTRRRETNHEQ